MLRDSVLADVDLDYGKYPWVSTEDGNPVRPLLLDALCFDVTNVWEYVEEMFFKPEDRSNWYRGVFSTDELVELLPNLAPLAPIMWFEWGTKRGSRRGVLIRAWQPWEPTYLGWHVEAYGIFSFSVEHPEIPSRVISSGVHNEADAFIYRVAPLGAYRGGYMKIIGEDIFWDGHHMKDKLTKEELEDGVNYLPDFYGTYVPALYAICFAHCRNVAQRELVPSHRREVDGAHRPAITYKVLDIDPARTVLERKGQIAQNGPQRALHLCRGHFSHYTEENKLFGKYTGTFYVPMHTRGTLKAGAVIKDYNVKAPGTPRPCAP